VHEALYGPIEPSLARRARLLGGALLLAVVLVPLAVATAGADGDAIIGAVAISFALGSTAIALLGVSAGFPVGGSWRHLASTFPGILGSATVFGFAPGVVTAIALGYCVALAPAFLAVRLNVLRAPVEAPGAAAHGEQAEAQQARRLLVALATVAAFAAVSVAVWSPAAAVAVGALALFLLLTAATRRAPR
jgi:hypothetical protein